MDAPAGCLPGQARPGHAGIAPGLIDNGRIVGPLTGFYLALNTCKEGHHVDLRDATD